MFAAGAGAGGGLFDGPNIFMPKTQAYVLLPPRYGAALGIETFHYYVTESFVRDRDAAAAGRQTVECTLLEHGEAVAGRTIRVPVSVVESRKVKRGETYTRIGEYTYQYCLIRTASSLQGSSAQELRYGQVVKVSWQQNTVWENVNAHSKLHVQLDSETDVRVVQLADVIPCSVVAFLARPLEHASASAFDNADIEQLHERIDRSIQAKTPLVFKEAFATSGRSVDEIHWSEKRSIYTSLGTRESVQLDMTINEARKKLNLIAWVILRPLPDPADLEEGDPAAADSYPDDTDPRSTGLTAAQTAALVQQKCHEYFIQFNSWRQTIKTPEFLKRLPNRTTGSCPDSTTTDSGSSRLRSPVHSIKTMFQTKPSTESEPKQQQPKTLWTMLKSKSSDSAPESLQP